MCLLTFEKQDEIILWFGMTESWTLLVYENTVGIKVYDTVTHDFKGTILEDANQHEWTQIPVMDEKREWLYKISGNTILKARLKTDADIEDRSNVWHHVWTCQAPILAVLVPSMALPLQVVTADGHMATVGQEQQSAKAYLGMLDVDQLFDSCGRWIVSLHGNGRVMVFSSLLKNGECIVKSGCYVLAIKGSFVAMAGCFEQPDKHMVIVHDLHSGWFWAVATRGFVSDIHWTSTGHIIALCGKTVFLVGGKQVKVWI